MANGRYDDRGRGGSNGPKVQPWDLYRIVQVEKRDKVEDEWVQCGVLWKMKEREGLTFTLHFALPEGARMAAMPRTQKEDR